jgi:hypothetical protein
MDQPTSTVPSVSNRQFRWGSGMTVLWTVVIAAVTFVVTLVAGFALGMIDLLQVPDAEVQRTEEWIGEYLLASMNRNFAYLAAVQGLTVLAMVWLLTRARDGLSRAHMLRLKAVSLRSGVAWVVGGLAVVIAFGEILKLFMDIGDKEALAWLSVLQPAWIGFVVLVFIGPISEEVLFRGFIFGGLAQSVIGPVGAIVVTSALWAVLHLQYTWVIMAVIFVYGLVFGAMRWKSASLWPPVVAHCVVNLLSGVAYYLGASAT